MATVAKNSFIQYLYNIYSKFVCEIYIIAEYAS